MTERATAERAAAREIEQRKELEPVNVGEQPITSRVDKGSPERRKLCDDTKINDPDRGLFLAADGISGAAKTGSGAYISRDLAKRTHAYVGVQLDKDIASFMENDQLSDVQKIEMIEAQVEAQMKRAINESHQEAARVQQVAKETNDLTFKEAGTTSTMAKIIDLPGGGQRMYFSNIGDSAAFLLRDGKLRKLTFDDNFGTGMLRTALKEGAISETEFEEKVRAFENASSADDAEAVYDGLGFAYQHNNIVTAAIGGSAAPEVRMQHIDLLPGDRVMFATDGLTDVMTDAELERISSETVDDAAAERALQNRADEYGGMKSKADAKAAGGKKNKIDDIAVVVRTIPEQRAEQEAQPEQAEQTQEAPVDHMVNVRAWQGRVRVLDREVLKKRREVREATGVAERFKFQAELKGLEMEQATLEYNIAETQKDLLDQDLPPRFKKNKIIRVAIGEPGSPPKPFLVTGFNQETDKYTLRMGTKTYSIDRYKLELAHKEPLVRVGDTVPVEMPGQPRQDGFGIIAIEKGRVNLYKTDKDNTWADGRPKTFTAEQSVERTDRMVREQLQHAKEFGERRERARKHFFDAKADQERAVRKYQQILERSARESAQRAAK